MIPNESALTSVVIVGTGRLGSALSHALHLSGVPARAFSSRVPADLAGATLVLVAVSDGAIPAVAERLAGARGDAATPSVALHHSGVLDATALGPLERRGFSTGSCHPLQTFPDRLPRADAFRGVTFALEGAPRAVDAGRMLAARLGGRSQEIQPEKKALYHLAAALAANGLVGLIGASRDALVACGFHERDALDALSPLVTTALRGALEGRPEDALSGPVSRGDLATLEFHRAALADWSPERSLLYEALVSEQERLLSARERKS